VKRCAGGVAVRIAIDQNLGEGSAVGTVVLVGRRQQGGEQLSQTGEEALEKQKLGGKRLGLAGAAITAGLDIQDVFEGKDKVEKNRKKTEAIKSTLEALISGTGDLSQQLVLLDNAPQALQASVTSAIARGNDTPKNYEAIKAEIVRAPSGS
jgi:hypothetical protein